MAEEIKEKTAAEVRPTRKRKAAVKDDWVNHPGHYTKGKYECKNVLTDLLMHKELDGAYCWLIGNALKYLWRAGDKPGDYGKTREQKTIEDLEKARFYINEAIGHLGGPNENDKK